MRIAIFGTKPYDRHFLEAANREHHHELVFLEPRLSAATAILAQGCHCVCAFVNDEGNAATLQVLAEHAVALMLAMNRQIHRAHQRVREGNFSLQGLLGFDMHGRTVRIIGTGAIGAVVAKIVTGFGCQILAYDKRPNPLVSQLGGTYVELPRLWRASDIITLHCPLTPETRYLVNGNAVAQMKPGVMLINTSRGTVVDTQAVLAGLKTDHIGSLGLDVYEEEADLFFEDCSQAGIEDDVLARLTTFPNVLITGHQAFFARDALQQIAATTLHNVTCVEQGLTCANEVQFSA